MSGESESQRFRGGVKAWYVRMDELAAERDGYKRDFLAASERRAWADARIANLTHALETVRREVDLPEYIAEFVGDALAAAVSPPAEQEPCAACGYVGGHSDVCPTHLFAEPSA